MEEFEKDPELYFTGNYFLTFEDEHT